MRNFFWGRACSRRVGRLMSKHEERWLRVLQLGSRVTLLVDMGPVGEPVECQVCGKPVVRVYNTCSTGHRSLNEPFCREHHPSPLARHLAG